MMRPVTLAELYDLDLGDMTGMYETAFGPLVVFAEGIVLFAKGFGVWLGSSDETIESLDDGVAFMVED